MGRTKMKRLAFLALLALVATACVVNKYVNSGGTCRWTLDCPILPLGDNGGNLWPYAPGATTGSFTSGWVQWRLAPYPAAANTCTNFSGTSTYPELPTPLVRGTVYDFTLTGACTGVDLDGKPYVLATTQVLEMHYSSGGGGRGGGGAGWKLADKGGTTAIAYQ